MDLFLTYSLELSLLSKSLFNYSYLILQELEIQARAHGLPTLASLVTVDLGAHITKQQTHLEQNSGDYCQQLVLSQGTSPEMEAMKQNQSDKNLSFPLQQTKSQLC